MKNSFLLSSKKQSKKAFDLTQLNDKIESLLPPLPLKWPADLKEIALTENEKKAFEDAFLQVLPLAFGEDSDDYNLICHKDKINGKSQRKLILFNGQSKTKEFDIPISFTVNINDKKRLSHITLWTKSVIGSGGERKVKKCYNLMTGEYLARKKIITKVEELILKNFRDHRTPGIEPIQSIHRAAKQRGFKNDHFIEPIFEGNLVDLLGQITPSKDVFSVLNQLATGLSALHAFTPVEIETKQTATHVITTTTTYDKVFHWDIKPENILLRKQSPSTGDWEAFLADFGVANRLFPGNGTVYYLSPEDVELKSSLPQLNNPEEIKKKGLAYSQKKDIWALGLVFIRLVTKRCYTVTLNDVHTPPTQHFCHYLASIVKVVFKDNKVDWNRLPELKQADLDADIATLKIEFPEYAYLWDNLIIKMLQVDPEKRISSQQMVEILSLNPNSANLHVI